MDRMREGLEGVLGQRVGERPWRQAQLKVSHGGTGLLGQNALVAAAYT